MNANTTDERASRPARVGALLEEARSIQAELTALYAELAARHEPDPPRERHAAELLAQRDQLIHDLGLAVLEAGLAGASVQLEWPPGAAEVEEPAVAEVVERESIEATPLPQTHVEARPVTPPAVAPPAPDPVVPPVTTGAVAPPVAADAEALRRLAQRGLGPNWEQDQRKQPGEVARLFHAVLDAIGPPLVVDDEETLEEEARRISRESDRLERWLDLDRNSQQLLLSYSAAKARYLQERAREGSAPASAVAGLDPAFRVMNRYSKEYRPGFVWGLSRSHTPKRGHWLEDAEQYWQELLELAGRSPKVETNPERALGRLEAVLDREPPEEEVREAALDVLASGVSATDPRLLRLLEPYVDALTGRPLKGLRRALRDSSDHGDDDDAEEPPPVPADWECFGWTVGKVAVVVGGDRRAEAAERIQEAFGFAEVEWDSDVQGTKLVNIAERVFRGSVGMVIFLARLSSHGAQAVLLEACKEAEVPFVRVERGYGVTAVRLAIEQLYGQAALTSTR